MPLEAAGEILPPSFLLCKYCCSSLPCIAGVPCASHGDLGVKAASLGPSVVGHVSECPSVIRLHNIAWAVCDVCQVLQIVVCQAELPL